MTIGQAIDALKASRRALRIHEFNSSSKDYDICFACGHGPYNEVHLRAGESAITAKATALKLIAEALGEDA